MIRLIPFWLQRHIATAAAACVMGCAVALRVVLVLQGWPGTDSDDATMGLMARHILLRGERPIFFWGQAYMGTVEAYVGAFVFALFGASPATLKIGLILIYTVFLLVMFLLLWLLFGQRWAVVGLLFLSLGSPAVFALLLQAYGGYLETLLFGALLILLACYLIRTNGELSHPRRLMLVGAWGLVAGFSIYSDPLVAPFVLLSALALIFVFRRQLLGRVGLLVCLCFLIGISPWMIYVATARSASAATSFWQHQPTQQQTSIPGTTASAPPSPLSTVETHLLGVVVIAIPDMTGGMSLCPHAEEVPWPPGRWGASATQSCIVVRGIWGSGVVALMLLTLLWEGNIVRRLLWRRNPQDWTEQERRQAMQAIGSTLAVAAPLGTAILFAISSASATAPWIYERYLITLLIAFPILLAHLGKLVGRLFTNHAVRLSLSAAGLILLLGIQFNGMVAVFQQVQAQQRANAQQMDLVQQLLTRHDYAIYSEFWTCYRTAFQSNERVVCSVLDANFMLKPNRYAPYDTQVQATQPPVFVFPLNVPQARLFPELAKQRGWRYTTIIVDNQWVIFEVNPSGCCVSAQQIGRQAPRAAF